MRPSRFFPLSLCLMAGLAASACEAPLPPGPEAGAGALSESKGPGAGGVPGNIPARGDARVIRGFALAPVPLDLSSRNPALVGLGSYLAHVHACSGCHTNPAFAPGGDPYLGQPEAVNEDGYMAGGRSFGPFVARNITPRANGLPGGLTLEEFFQVLREGTDFRPAKPLLQVMPWPYTSHMTDQEIHAIYEYLSAIPCRVRPDQNPGHCG